MKKKETITPQSDLLAYYGDRLIYIEDDTHKTCIVDFNTILSIALSEEPYKTFWSICYKRHLSLIRDRDRMNAERQIEYDKANATGKMVNDYYIKLQ